MAGNRHICAFPGNLKQNEKIRRLDRYAPRKNMFSGTTLPMSNNAVELEVIKLFPSESDAIF
jgi:hypothetical protein